MESDPALRMYAIRMIEQVPTAKPYGRRHLYSLEKLLRLIHQVITLAPEFSEKSMVMTPLAGRLDWTMGTPAGFAFYRDPRVNEAFNDVLNTWCEYLNSPDSLYVLNESAAGWNSEDAQRIVVMDQFVHDPSEEHWGFTSWNDFFTRHFKDGERPVAAPDEDRIITSVCESTP